MMEDNFVETPSPEVCVSKIFEISGVKFDPEIAADLWPKILKHKWLLSEKLSRDVGLRTAGVDFVDNME
jgi:transitional endoplasmic reticulum ATPase